MRTFTAHTTATSAPHDVLDQLTDPAEVACWAPIPFEVLELDEKRLYPGANVRVRGRLAEQRAEFDVHVLEVSDKRLTLVAEGPVSLEVAYDVRPGPTRQRHPRVDLRARPRPDRAAARQGHRSAARRRRAPKLSEPSSQPTRPRNRRMIQKTSHTHNAANDPVRTQKEVNSVSQTTLDKYAKAGLWALPIYGVANLIGTLSSQPDYHKAGLFPAYARYIHTPQFLASHLGASLLGTGIGLLGFTALCVYLMTTRRSGGVPVAAFVSTVLGSIYMAAMFGVAAFAQPAIGKAFLAGHHDVIGLNSSVYGPPANVTAGVATALFFAGAVMFAIAISRSRTLPRTAGILFAAAFPVYAIGSITGTVLAPVAALVQIASTIWIARSASRTGSNPESATATSDRYTPAMAALDA